MLPAFATGTNAKGCVSSLWALLQLDSGVCDPRQQNGMLTVTELPPTFLDTDLSDRRQLW